jgi:hypothetical protein
MPASIASPPDVVTVSASIAALRPVLLSGTWPISR